MPSTLPGFQSGGQPLFSGMFLSGASFPSLTSQFGGIRLRTAVGVSGIVYAGVALGVASGGITLTSGGAFTSGGLADAWELPNGQETFIPRNQFAGQPEKIHLLVPAAVSGTLRVFWRPE